MLDHSNLYGAAALVRQMVEVEYLAWAFAEDEDEAASWLRSKREDRLKMWQPRHLRSRSAGQFRATDFHLHCEMGGHLSPEGRRLLPDRKTAPALPPALWWIELATHCSSTWEYMEVAAGHLGYLDQLQAAGAAEGVPEATVKWRAEERLRELLLRSLPRA